MKQPLLSTLVSTLVGSALALTALHAHAVEPKIAVGSDYMMLLKSDGTVWSWGGAGYGELGDGAAATTQKPTPAKIAGLTGVTRIARGTDALLALQADGTSIGWGYNTSTGVIPNSSSGTTGRIAPTVIPVAKMKYLEGVGSNTSGVFMGIDLNGDVWSWGDNNSGVYSCNQPRGGAITVPYAPTGLTTASTKMKQIAGGNGFVLFLNEIGVVKACGGNSYGELGDGTTTSTSSSDKPGPIIVGGLPPDVRFVAAGGYASAAISASGSVYTWGRGDSGYAGIANSAAKNLTPVKLGIDAGALATAPATISGTQTGNISEATADVGLWAAPQHVGKEGEIYLAAVLPNGAILMLNQQGSFVPINAAAIQPLYQGVLPKSLPLPLITEPSDLRALAGTSIVLGYGLGKGAAANTDLLTSPNRLAVALRLR